MMTVRPSGRLTPTLRGHILVNLRGLLELLAVEQGCFRPERPTTFLRERRAD